MTQHRSGVRPRAGLRPLVASWLPRQPRLGMGLALATLGPLVIAAVLLPARAHVDGAVFGLALLVPTVVGAAVGGPVAAALAVVTGSLTHNLLFTEPYLTLRVADTTDVVGLVVHALAAVAVSLVVVREQRAAALAAARSEQSARLAALEQVDRLRTALLGAVSHDLRTPLAVIAAAASDLRATDVSFSDDERSLLALSIEEQAARLDRTVANILHVSRLRADAVTLQREAIEADDLVREAVLSRTTPPAAERVHVAVAAGTPPLLVDPTLMAAAIGNLIDNALRMGPDGASVHVQARRSPTGVLLAVRDHGPGLRGRRVEELAEPFHTSDEGAVGLGLAIARGFVEAHGGVLRARDAGDGRGGAVFEVDLPATEEPEP